MQTNFCAKGPYPNNLQGKLIFRSIIAIICYEVLCVVFCLCAVFVLFSLFFFFLRNSKLYC